MQKDDTLKILWGGAYDGTLSLSLFAYSTALGERAFENSEYLKIQLGNEGTFYLLEKPILVNIVPLEEKVKIFLSWVYSNIVKPFFKLISVDVASGLFVKNSKSILESEISSEREVLFFGFNVFFNFDLLS